MTTVTQVQEHIADLDEIPSSSLSETKYGIPIDRKFAEAASETQLQKTAESLRKNGFVVEIVDTPSDARKFVNSILPLDQTIFTASSETVKQSGLDHDINVSGKYKSLRQQLARMDPKTQFREQVKLGATSDVIVGSVHAVTEKGHLVTGSASGSQLGPYAASAAKVILVVGSQKIVPDIDTAMRRVETYSYPMEDIRMHEVRGMPSNLAKILIVRRELMPNRVTVVLVREPIGF